MIYIITKKGLNQNKVNSSLDCNCEIGYYCFPFSCRCRCSVCLYYGLHLHVLNNQQKSDQVKYMYMVGPPFSIYYKFITVNRIR